MSGTNDINAGEALERADAASNNTTRKFWLLVAARRLDVRANREMSADEIATAIKRDSHICDDNAVPYESDGALGHGFECGVCGRFLQAG